MQLLRGASGWSRFDGPLSLESFPWQIETSLTCRKWRPSRVLFLRAFGTLLHAISTSPYLTYRDRRGTVRLRLPDDCASRMEDLVRHSVQDLGAWLTLNKAENNAAEKAEGTPARPAIFQWRVHRKRPSWKGTRPGCAVKNAPV